MGTEHIRNVIIVDMDGTISDCGHRQHLAANKDWDAFHAVAHLDAPIGATIQALRAFYASSYDIIICTGRGEEYRRITERWLEDHGVAEMIETILMRPRDDYRPDHEIKLEAIDRYFGGREKALERVVLILEDRERVVQGWRDAGFTCWQVNIGDF